MNIRFIDNIDAIDAAQWNAIAGSTHPFTRHEFLAALEHSGAVSRETGWQPQHALVEQDGALVAVMPLYLKFHSYGEYVFDWAWADAWKRAGIAYYPKLLTAIPYTPATGPRLCCAEGIDQAEVVAALSLDLREQADTLGFSSLHILFSDKTAVEQWQLQQLAPRMGVQFHWYNRDYSDFDDFLADFSSRKRKNLRKERARVAAQQLELEVLEGPDISPELWQTFYQFYRMTYAKRSGHGGYLGLEFFQQIAETLPQHIVLVMAKHRGRYVAGALNFRDRSDDALANKSCDTLYGRYWGCIEEFECLHFEACYYRGIDYCIENKLARFDPGAQGEHKIQRGFTPVATWSNHWVAEPGFSQPIADFLRQENEGMEQYLMDSTALLPFKSSD